MSRLYAIAAWNASAKSIEAEPFLQSTCGGCGLTSRGDKWQTYCILNGLRAVWGHIGCAASLSNAEVTLAYSHIWPEKGCFVF